MKIVILEKYFIDLAWSMYIQHSALYPSFVSLHDTHDIPIQIKQKILRDYGTKQLMILLTGGLYCKTKMLPI